LSNFGRLLRKFGIPRANYVIMTGAGFFGWTLTYPD